MTPAMRRRFVPTRSPQQRRRSLVAALTLPFLLLAWCWLLASNAGAIRSVVWGVP